MKFLNLTGKRICFVDPLTNETVKELPSDGEVKIKKEVTTGEISDIPVAYCDKYVSGLPSEKKNVQVIVPEIIYHGFPEREDLCFPDEIQNSGMIGDTIICEYLMIKN